MAIASIEVHKWIEQHSPLINTSRISQFYRTEKNQMYFALHTKEGQRFLLLSIPDSIELRDVKPEGENRETGFGRWMRSNLKGAIIQEITQIGSERVIEIKLRDYSIFIELYGKGNIIVTEKGKIRISLEKQIQKDREIKKGEEYVPPTSFDTYNANAKDFDQLIKENTDSDLNASKLLATKLGLGGAYASQLCEILKIDADSEISSLKGKDLKEGVKKLLESDIDIKKIKVVAPKKESAYDKKLKKIDSIISNQKKTLEKSNKDIVELNNMGEFIYNNYAKFEELGKVFKFAQDNKKEITDDVLKKVVDFKMKYKKPYLEVDYE